jgi:prolyl 4-hydroxylase
LYRYTVADSPLGTTSASVQLLSESPLLLVFDHFLSPTECEDLMAIASPDLRRSRVTDGKLSDGRTSCSTFLTGARQDEPLVRVIEQRILRAVRSAGLIAARRVAQGSPRSGGSGGGSSPPRVENVLTGAEPMQVVRYTEGQMYTAHYDNKQGCTRRAATFMMYLTDVDAGGATHFPKVRGCTSSIQLTRSLKKAPGFNP